MNDENVNPPAPATSPEAIGLAKWKADWFTPVLPSTLVILGVLRLTMNGKTDVEIILNMLLGAFMIYAAFFNFYNVARRKLPNDRLSRGGEE